MVALKQKINEVAASEDAMVGLEAELIGSAIFGFFLLLYSRLQLCSCFIDSKLFNIHRSIQARRKNIVTYIFEVRPLAKNELDSTITIEVKGVVAKERQHYEIEMTNKLQTRTHCARYDVSTFHSLKQPFLRWNIARQI